MSDTAQAIGYCTAPAVLGLIVSGAPWFIGVITGLLGSTWYIVQLRKEWKAARKKDHDTTSDPR